MLSDDIAEGNEAYEFTWVGKKTAMAEASKPTRKTLRPCKEESVDWDNTENLYIEGDNLEVLKLLQESYLGKVKMIYIDPPYNTGNDFIYDDDFNHTQHEEDVQMGAFDEDDNRLFKNTETNGRFHSDWCSMIYPRLMLARNLLSDDGVIFISIDDNEQENLKKICDEVFGADNFIAEQVWKSKPQGGNDNKYIISEHEYIFAYAKDINRVHVYGKRHGSDKYSKKDEYFRERGGYATAKLDLSTLEYRVNLDYPITCPDGSIIFPGNVTENEWQHRKTGGNLTRDWQWRWSKERYEKALGIGLIEFKYNGGRWTVYTKEYESMDYDGNHISRTIKSRTIIDDVTTIDGTNEMKELLGSRVFTYSKPVQLIRSQCAIGSASGDIVLDFFSGSATTAHAVMQLNAEDGGKRKFIMVQLDEKCDEKSEAYKAGYKNVCEIGKERIRRAGKRIKEENPAAADLDIGFRVLKLDSGNMEDVYYSADEYTQDMLARMESNIKPDRTDMDLLFGCLLEWGLKLDMPYTSEKIEGYTVHTYNDGDLIACFEENIPESVIMEIAKREPLRAVFRDSGFTSAPEKINMWERFKLIAPDTRVKVI